MDPSYNEINVGLGNVATYTYNYINSILSNPSAIIILIIVIVAYIAVFMSLGSSTSIDSVSPSNNGSSKITVIIIAVFIVLILLNASPYFFGTDIVTKIKNLLLTGQSLNMHGILGVTIGAVLTCSEVIGMEKLLNKILDANKTEEHTLN